MSIKVLSTEFSCISLCLYIAINHTQLQSMTQMAETRKSVKLTCSKLKEKGDPEYEELMSNLPTERGWVMFDLCFYQGAWLLPSSILAYLAMREHFRGRPSDVLVATVPKSGTTWLKALAFAIRHRASHPPNAADHPLLGSNSHDLVRFLEHSLYRGGQVPDLDELPSPRLFGTHFPFPMISNVSDSCKLVFLCRNPGDAVISLWTFINRWISTAGKETQTIPLEEALDMFCDGRSVHGPYWDLVLGYWEASKQEPEKVLFLQYEEMRHDPSPHVKRLASFMGLPFTEEEEKRGVVEDIINLCSFDKLSNLEVNKKGTLLSGLGVPNHTFYRRGIVGDWNKYLTSDMVERLNCITKEKMKDSGLDLILHF